MKPRIKLAFCDFWPAFNPANNYFTRLLSRRFDVEITDRPDFVIFSCFGRRHREFDCTRIFFTGENWRPDFRHYDFALTFDHCNDPRHYRFPLYGASGDPAALVKPADFDPTRVLAEKTRFCNFVYSNPLCRTRNRFFHKLSKYKPVDSGGKLFNNLGGPIKDKLALVRQSKFTIAFENESHSGYTTEKLAEPMHANSLPIYWGNPDVGLDFNSRSFITLHDWPSIDAAIEHIVEVDRNDELYLEYLRQPWYHDNRMNQYVDPENVLAWFERVFENPSWAAGLKGKTRTVMQFDLAADMWSSIQRRLRRTARKLVYRFDRAVC
jgi:hypothetical protein